MTRNQIALGVVSQLCEGAFASSRRRRQNPRCHGRELQRLLCLEISTSPWFTASCCSDASQAVIQPLCIQRTSEVPSVSDWVATTHTCAHPLSNACTSLGRHCNTTRPSRSSLHGSVHFLGMYVAAFVWSQKMHRSVTTKILLLDMFLRLDA